MDACEATKIVMARIKELDMENASKILGHILLQAQGEKEVIRLAFAPESLLQSCVNQSKACLGLPSNNPSSEHSTHSNHALHFHNPSSPAASFTRNVSRPISYTGVLNCSGDAAYVNGDDSSGLASLHSCGTNDFRDEFLCGTGVRDPLQHQVHDYPSLEDDLMVDPTANALSLLRRCSSVNGAAFRSNIELGWKPCMYFARGVRKNGESCWFSHNGVSNSEGLEVGSPGMGSSGFDEFGRQTAQQHMLTLMASGGHHPFHYKYMNLQDKTLREDLSSIVLCSSSSARQIYLTFPADSTFKEEDVAGYFNIFGPVQDVRIPYQQRRMFGFVTFVYSETVKRILAKGNPHFIHDSRVLVKPYKEKGKLLEKKQFHQHMDRGNYTSCLCPSLSDSIEQLDIPFGPRMLLDAQEKIFLRRLEEQEELRNAIELQGQKMTKLQLVDQQDQHDTRYFQFDIGQEASKTPNDVAVGGKMILRVSDLVCNNQHASYGDSFLPESYKRVKAFSVQRKRKRVLEIVIEKQCSPCKKVMCTVQR